MDLLTLDLKKTLVLIISISLFSNLAGNSGIAALRTRVYTINEVIYDEKNFNRNQDFKRLR